MPALPETIKRIIKQIWSFINDQYLIIFFTLTIGYKLYYFNTYISKITWPDNQYQFGIAFGYVTTALLFLPWLFVKKRKNLFVIIVASILSILILADAVYYSYFSSLPTIGILSGAGQAKDVGPAIADLIHWQLIFYVIDVIIAIITIKPASILFKKIKTKFNLPETKIYLPIITSLLIVIIFCINLANVGVEKLGEIVDKGYDTVSTSQYYGLFMSHVIDTARFIKEETISLSTEQEADLAKWVKDNKPAQSTSDQNAVAKGKNIIMIQVESLGGFVINQKINDKEITPNLNKLAANSNYFPNENFMIGAGHTSDADMSVNTSYFPLTDSAAFVLYGRDNYTGLPKTLIANGYKSAYAYHGFNRNFWNRDIALTSLGYQKFYAADNYSNGEKINMGLNDGDFLSETADYIAKQPKPSMSFVITLSSHTPFATTEKSRALGIDSSKYPTQVGDYLETINYTDRMLGNFFDKLKSAGLYDDSLIVIYGDHEPVLSAFEAGTIKYDPSGTQGKEVPLIIKTPNQTTGETYVNKGTHIDIMPTILDLTGIKTNQLMFGRSLFTDSKTCVDQIVTFPISKNCKADLETEKIKSATIIKYNQFENVNK